MGDVDHGLPSADVERRLRPRAQHATRTDSARNHRWRPLNLRITSPGLTPARAAALSGSTFDTSAPSGALSLKDDAQRLIDGLHLTPSCAVLDLAGLEDLLLDTCAPH